MKMNSIVDDFNNRERSIRHFETDIKIEEGHTIDALRVVVITGTGILSQRGSEGIEMTGGHKSGEF